MQAVVNAFIYLYIFYSFAPNLIRSQPLLSDAQPEYTCYARQRKDGFLVLARHNRCRLILSPSIADHQTEPLALGDGCKFFPRVWCHRAAAAQRLQGLEFPGVESGLQRWRAALLLVLHVDTVKLLDASICDLVLLVDPIQRSKVDAHPVICAHEIALCDAATVLGENEAVELVNCVLQVMLRE